MKTLRNMLGVGVVAVALSSATQAQGVLTVTPGSTISTTAGTETLGYSGDNSSAASATLASPSAVAYDSNGNLFLADTANHVIREVLKSSGNIITVAGTGRAGFSGDGAAATAAQLDTPTGIALDTTGNIYIADSHNHRIRKISGTTITTIAGTGVAGFSGDGGAATAAQLASPTGVAVDGSGNIFIADTNNQRVRKIAGATISTVAGTGEQSYSGDGSSATAATLDSPTSVAIDASGNVFIADRHNQRVREIVASSGNIITVAGTGTPTFAGSFSGDGGSAIAANLSKPSGVSVDAAGNIYIADSNNHRLRTVTAGGIATAAGTGEQGFTGDGGALVNTSLDTPKSAALDANGNLAFADKGNQRVRAATTPTLTFGSTAIGVPSPTQTVTLSNTGAASLTVNTASITGPYALTNASTCSTAPITIAAGASCTEVLNLTPANPGPANGSLSFSGAGVTPQTVLLAGTAVQGSLTIAVVSNITAPFVNQSITFVATLQPTGGGTATGTVTFYANDNQIGTPQNISANRTTLTTAFTTSGTYAITAVYSGDTNFGGSTSAALTQLVGDFNFTIVSDQPTSETVVPGQAATFSLTAAPLNGPFSFPITLSASGLPPGATVSFTPNPLTLGSTAVPFKMTIQTARTSGALRGMEGVGGTLLAFAILPFAWSMTNDKRKLQRLMTIGFVFLSTTGVMSLTGCGTNSGFFGQQTHTYTINVIGTATNAAGATLQHVATVQLTVQ